VVSRGLQGIEGRATSEFNYVFEGREVSRRRAVRDGGMQHYSLYTSKYNRAVLESLEMKIQRSEPVNLGNCTIEHVMPQTINDDPDGLEWKTVLGTDWKRVHDMWLHSIGNLTLVGYDYNILMKNRPYPVKKGELVGRSKVYLNEYFEPVDQWDEVQINERGTDLAAKLVPIWVGPDAFL
jgi:hypothetical protein